MLDMATTRRQTKAAAPQRRPTKVDRILSHVAVLQRIFPATRKMEPMALFKRLHRLEAEGNTAATRYCNEPLPEGFLEKKEASLLKRLDDLLQFKRAKVPVFYNTDPRGWALKIDDRYARTVDGLYTDMGGYGILAPKF